MAVLQADGFISDTGNESGVSAAATQAFAPDSPWAEYGNVRNIFTPDQAVMPMTVAEVSTPVAP